MRAGQIRTSIVSAAASMHDVFRDVRAAPRRQSCACASLRHARVRFRYLRLSSDRATHLGNCRYNGTPDTRDPLSGASRRVNVDVRVDTLDT